MVVDSSAVLAILRDEPERRRFSEAFEQAENALISAGNFLQCSLILESRLGPNAVREFDLLVSKSGMTVVPFDLEQAQIARRAFRRFGKGRHRAGLDLFDCCAYALASAHEEPLLFKGNAFSQTDLELHPSSAF